MSFAYEHPNSIVKMKDFEQASCSTCHKCRTTYHNVLWHSGPVMNIWVCDRCKKYLRTFEYLEFKRMINYEPRYEL